MSLSTSTLAPIPRGAPDRTGSNNPCALAAKGGHLEALQWAREHGCEWVARTCKGAALGGHLAVLMWARQHDCPWNEWACYEAAEGGHLAVLKWARANGCKWNKAVGPFI